jgi:hypothetical protein
MELKQELKQDKTTDFFLKSSILCAENQEINTFMYFVDRNKKKSIWSLVQFRSNQSNFKALFSMLKVWIGMGSTIVSL